MANKVQYGLQNVHIAPITVSSSGVYTWGIPVSIPGGVNISLDAEGDTETFYADNVKYYENTANNGYTGSLEIVLIEDDILEDYFGNRTDDNELLSEDANKKLEPFALLFQFEGDEKATRHVIYKVTPTRPNMESSTNEENVEIKTTTFDFTADPIVSGEYAWVKSKTTGNTLSTKYTGWYTTAPTLPTITESEG